MTQSGTPGLLLNGYSYCDGDLADFREFHARRRAAASLVLARVADVSRFGQVRVGEDGRVLRFEEKGAARGPGWISAGIYLLERQVIDGLPRGRPASLERDVLPGLVAGGQVAGYRCEGRFIDIGTPESYAAAQTFFEVLSLGLGTGITGEGGRDRDSAAGADEPASRQAVHVRLPC